MNPTPDLAWPFSWIVQVYVDDSLEPLAGAFLTVFVTIIRLAGWEKLFGKEWLRWLATGIALGGSILVGLYVRAYVPLPTPLSWSRIISAGLSIAAFSIFGWEIAVNPMQRSVAAWQARRQEAKAADPNG